MKNKKLLSLAMLGLISVGMFGCSNQKAPETLQNEIVENQTSQETENKTEDKTEDKTEEKAVDLAGIIAQIKTDITEMPMTMELTAEELPMLYGEDFTADKVEDFAVLAPMMQSTTEVAIFKAKDGDTQTIKDALQTRIENQMSVFETYLEDQYEIISNAQIFEADDYVYLISADETNFEVMQGIIETALSQAE